MNFQDLNLKISYKSQGGDKIVEDFLNPTLSSAKVYKRAVGFFSSSAFEPIKEGLSKLVQNGGRIQIVASPKISKEDIEAINTGHKYKNALIEERANEEFKKALDNLSDECLKILAECIANDIIDFKVAVTKNLGAYHDKLGIIEDWDGNIIVFSGSSNETEFGLVDNYEKVRLSRSWNVSELERVDDEINEFDTLWNDNNPALDVYSYLESAKKGLLEVIEHKGIKVNIKAENPVKLRDYQEKAIDAWKENGYRGFYTMATGTGKTWTAIFSIKELKKEKDFITVICAPYKHLLKQWQEDVKKMFPEAYIVLVSSENPNWNTEITTALYKKSILKNKEVIIISTIMSFSTEKFHKAINVAPFDKLLIVDEAHRFKETTEYIKNEYNYMLGLSATPYSGMSAESGNLLMNFFGGQVFSLDIDEAINKGYLVKYNYYPIFVNATEEEEESFKYLSQQMISCFKNGKLIDKDKLFKLSRSRLRLIALSDEKQQCLEDIIKKMSVKNHFIVYCGDGKVQSPEGELKHINSIKKVLDKCGYKASQFTAEENMSTRMALVDNFSKGYIDALAAIRCLDEGINIPSIESALILASNDDYREFVQRRGRILRKFGNKKEANIYDVIVLPSSDMQNFAKIELRRFLEYAKLAINKESNLLKLGQLLEEYKLTHDDIDVFDFETMENEEDE